MAEKTFKEKLEAEAENFAEIYMQFTKLVDELLETEQCSNVWDGSFNAPFDELGKQVEADAENAFNKSDPNYAVLSAIRSLRLDERSPFIGMSIREGRGLSVIDDAMELGVIDCNSVPQLQRIYSDVPDGPRISGITPDRSDPIFWRTMLEIFCRAYIGQPGRPAWGDDEYLQLAIDLNWICIEALNKNWDVEKARKHLNEDKAFRERYPSGSRLGAVGAKRITQLERWAGYSFGEDFVIRVCEDKIDLFRRWLSQRETMPSFSDQQLKKILKLLSTPLTDQDRAQQ